MEQKAFTVRLEVRREDPAFQARIRSIIEQNQRVLERLTE